MKFLYNNKKERNRLISILICTLLTIGYYIVVLRYI